VEVICAAAVPLLYYWEVIARGLDYSGSVADPWLLHLRWIYHLLLMAAMLAGSLIDLDERTLPDALTVPGTWLVLVVAALYPWALPADFPRMSFEARLQKLELGELPGEGLWGAVARQPQFLHLASPHDWPAALEGFPRLLPLALALGIWWLWCFALMDRRFYPRLGLRRAWGYFWARLLRSPVTWFAVKMGVVGTVGITGIWFWGGPGWRGLLSALVGLAVGAGLIWIVRLLGWWALRREAMGFGDVTLMGMLGAAVGWQGSLIVFFLAPMVALVFGVVHLVLRRESIIPYGPFLCLAGATVLLGWKPLWAETSPVFALGWVVPLLLGGCLLLMPPLLVTVRLLRMFLERWVLGMVEDCPDK
jgi:prepilin signal peptidase PulO-like enzyme (type II secretory pathway)